MANRYSAVPFPVSEGNILEFVLSYRALYQNKTKESTPMQIRLIFEVSTKLTNDKSVFDWVNAYLGILFPPLYRFFTRNIQFLSLTLTNVSRQTSYKYPLTNTYAQDEGICDMTKALFFELIPLNSKVPLRLYLKAPAPEFSLKHELPEHIATAVTEFESLVINPVLLFAKTVALRYRKQAGEKRHQIVSCTFRECVSLTRQGPRKQPTKSQLSPGIKKKKTAPKRLVYNIIFS
jgi:hypothetical protein